MEEKTNVTNSAQPPDEATSGFTDWAVEEEDEEYQPVRVVTMRLDQLDLDAVIRVVGKRLTLMNGCMPDGESCPLGAVIAEICRGWEEMLEMSAERHKQTE